jgi:hypothetical protein
MHISFTTIGCNNTPQEADRYLIPLTETIIWKQEIAFNGNYYLEARNSL